MCSASKASKPSAGARIYRARRARNSSFLFIILVIPPQSITEISAQTGWHKNAGTDDPVTISVCDVSGDCCSNSLNIPDHDDRVQGHLDTYSGPVVLGQCFNFVPTRGDLTVALEKPGSDGWNVQWTKVKLSGGRTFTCNFNIWLDNDNGHSNSETVQCQQDV